MKSQLILVITLLFSLFAQAQTQPKYSRAKILLTKDHTILQLGALGLAVDHGDYAKGRYFMSDFSMDELQKARNASFKVEIVIDDVVQRYIDQNKNSTGGQQKTTGLSTCDTMKKDMAVPAHFHLGSYGGYFTYQEMLNNLDSMQLLYPNLINTRSAIGTFTTIEGRPIYWVRVSNNPTVNQPAKPQMLYTAVHHAREPGSLSATIFYLWYLLENYNTDPQIKSIVDNNELYFVPMINPDGYLYNQLGFPGGGGMWRKNRRHYANNDYGTDLNRNYGQFWGFDNIGSSNLTSDDTYRGTAAFSEPETQAIKWFCENHQFKIALNYHTYQNDILYPYGHLPNTYTADSLAYRAFGGLVTQNNHYRDGTCIEMLGYFSNGDSDDWMYGEQTTKPKIFGFTPEIGDPNLGFYPPASYIIPYCKDNLRANVDAAALLEPYAVIKSQESKIFANTSGYVHYSLKRLGLPSTGSFTVTAVSLSPALTISSTPKVYSGLTQLQMEYDSLSYTINASTANNTSLSYVLKVNNGFYDLTDTVQVYCQKYVLATQQSVNSLTGWINSGWGVSNTIYHTAPSSIKSSINGVGNYSDVTDATIETANSFDLGFATKAYLQFYSRWEIEEKYDYVMVEVAEAGSSAWTALCGRYTKPGLQFQIMDLPLYDGAQYDWVMEQMDLHEWLGKKIKIKFELISDASGNRDGFYFDDVQVVASYDNPLSVKNMPVAIGSPAVYPNPANEAFTLVLPAYNAGHTYRLAVYDCLGREVLTQTLIGEKTVVNTASLPANIYYIKITDNDNQYPVQKIELVK